jgi:hypothetical protein
MRSWFIFKLLALTRAEKVWRLETFGTEDPAIVRERLTQADNTAPNESQNNIKYRLSVLATLKPQNPLEEHRPAAICHYARRGHEMREKSGCQETDGKHVDLRGSHETVIHAVVINVVPGDHPRRIDA